MGNIENEVPTALSLVYNKKSYHGIPPTPLEVSELMIEFATLHLEAQLKEIIRALPDPHYIEDISQAYNIEENVK